MVRYVTLGILVGMLYMLAPVRLVLLGAEMFMVHPGQTRFSSDDQGYWDALNLEARLVSLSWEVKYEKDLNFMGQSVYGLTVPSKHMIFIEEGLHWSARAAVLAHEGGHTMQPNWVSGPEGDCFAEGVALLTRGDALLEHARYLSPARWTCAGFLMTEFPAIYHAAMVLRD
jgi:hypothetical protein